MGRAVLLLLAVMILLPASQPHPSFPHPHCSGDCSASCLHFQVLYLKFSAGLWFQGLPSCDQGQALGTMQLSQGRVGVDIRKSFVPQGMVPTPKMPELQEGLHRLRFGDLSTSADCDSLHCP